MNKWWFFLIGLIVVASLWQITQRRQGGDALRFANPISDKLAGSGVTAPGFEGGGTWLNSEPLVLADLVGAEAKEGAPKAVLVDFWTYSCINCQRTIPYLQSWWEKYEDKGLVIVGVHSPEFDFEKDTDNVKAATAKYGVSWPVVQDNEMKIWRAYRNRYWPRKYLVNSEGKIVYDHIGEGGYEETEKRIQELLGVGEMEVTEEPAVGGIGFGMKQTPELYLTERGRVAGDLGKGMDRVELTGEWEVEEDYSEAGKGAGLRLEYKAGEMNLVMSLASSNGSGADSGVRRVKVRIDGGEEKEMTIKANDLYSLWKGEFGKHTLTMEVDEGVRLHAFTFGQ